MPDDTGLLWGQLRPGALDAAGGGLATPTGRGLLGALQGQDVQSQAPQSLLSAAGPGIGNPPSLLGAVFDANATPSSPGGAGGEEHANGAGGIVVAGTHINSNGQIVTTDYPPYYNYDPVSRKSFDIHEGIHSDQLKSWYPKNWLGSIESPIDYNLNPQKFEVPAYQAQVDYLQNYLLNHPYASTPNWPRIFKTQQQIEDRLQEYSNVKH